MKCILRNMHTVRSYKNYQFKHRSIYCIVFNVLLLFFNAVHLQNDVPPSHFWQGVYTSQVNPYFLGSLNSLRPIQNGRHFADDIFKSIFLNENIRISLKISLKFVPKVQNNNILALVQIMAWRRPGDKPSSEPMMVSLLTHICVTRPQWVNAILLHMIAEV